MKVLVVTNPGVSHLHAMMPVMQALQHAGHDVAVASSKTFGPLVERLGFRACEAGLDWFEPDLADAFPEIETMTTAERRMWLIRSLYADITPHAMVPDVLAICQEWKPDLLLRNDYEFAACVVGEKLGLPYATVGIDLCLPLPLWERLIGEQLAYLRSVCGLQPYPAVEGLYRSVYVSITPPSYQFPEFGRRPQSYAVRSLGFDRWQNDSLPGWVSRLPDQPTVYATIGTVYQDRDIFQAILDGLAGEPVNLIVTLGRGRDTAQFGPQPPNVHIAQYIPQTLLFPYCRLVITSGSYNTHVSALAHGLPLLVIPISDTQPYHALRCVDMGVGLALTRADQYEAELEGKRKDLSPQTVREAVFELLQNPSYGRRAERVQQEIRNLPGPEFAVGLLEALAARPARLAEAASC